MTKTADTREIILEILTQVLEKNRYSHIVLREVLGKYGDLEKTSRSFITKVSEGTIEDLIKLDYILELFSKVKVKKMKPLIRNLLRMSVYQLLYLDSVPESAVCNEAVKIAARHGFTNLKGFVNGVLRNIIRNQDTFVWPDQDKEPLKAYSVTYSMPEWIIKLWINDYGTEKTEKILKGLSDVRNVAVRCNFSKASKDEILSLLKEQGVKTEESPLLAEALFLSGYDKIETMKAHQKGFITVQDISSMLVSRIASPRNGDYVIDICGAPGGKSLHMADLLNGSGHIEVRDVSEYKIGLIQQNIDRCGFSNMEALVQDAAVLDENSVGKADILIADLPCSGLGVISKKTDLKYKLTKESIKSLVTLQRQILKASESYVKNGGVLIYSTCTVNRQENQENVEWFLEHFPYRLESIKEFLPKELWTEDTGKGYLQLYPGLNHTDGFFIAKFRRNLNG